MATQKGRNWSSGDIVTAANLSSIERGVSAVAEEYTPTTWANGDTVTAAGLNNIEQGIANAGGGSSDFSTALVTLTSTTEEGDSLEFPFTYVVRNISAMRYGAVAEWDNLLTYEAVLFNGAVVVESPTSSVVTSGSATVNPGPGGRTLITITGDCTITISSGGSPK